MSTLPNNAYDILLERGLIQQVTHPELLRQQLQKPTTIYIGYDPTANSLHVGHLFTLMCLRRLQEAGHRCIALLGGGTAAVGDPTGKTEMRPMLTRDEIQDNSKGMQQQILKILNVGDQQALVVNNADWWMDVHYIEFLRTVGRHFSVNRMIATKA